MTSKRLFTCYIFPELLCLQAFESAQQQPILFYIIIHMDGIVQFDEFPITLENNQTNEKMVIESRLSANLYTQVRIRRIPLNSALSFQDMWEMDGERLPLLKMLVFTLL